jgi:uncharacterized membrane protein
VAAHRFQFSRERLALLALIGLCAILFSYLSVVRHYTFNTAVYDLAMYDQAVWNTSQGRPFAINLLEDTMPGLTNKLGDHVEPILLPLAALYWIRSNPDVLLIVQALALAALIWPLYHLVRDRSSSVWLAGIAVALYLLHPGMWNALLFDFHPVTLGAAFLVFTLRMLVQRKHLAALIFAVLAMTCKEQIGLSVALLGVYTIFFVKHPSTSLRPAQDASQLVRFFQARDWRFGLLLIAIGVVWSFIALGVIIPAFQPQGDSYYLNRYGRLGGTFLEVLLSPITKPDVFWPMISGPKRVAYYGDLLLPLGFLPFLGFEMLLPALPDIALNTLSAFAPSRTLDYHYAVIAVPFLVLATAWGIDRLARGLGRKTPRARRAVLIAASALALIAMGAYQLDRYHSFVPLSDRYAGTYTIKPRDSIGWQMAAQIPPDAIVSGQFTLLPHVSQRQRAHIFPRIEDAEYVFLDMQGFIEPFQTRKEYQAAVEALRADPLFEVIAEQDGFFVLRRK